MPEAAQAAARTATVRTSYRWFAAGDINGFFALTIDNLALLAGMSAILLGVFHLPADLVLGRMLPGSALGVLVGDLAYSLLALRLARRTGRDDVCAMPLGIDTPSMFGLCFGVIGPLWLLTHDAQRTLAVSSAVLAAMGLAKIAGAFLGEHVRRSLPRSAMLGALAAVAIALIGFTSLQKIAAEPVGGLVALGVVLSALVAGRRLPWGVPAMIGALALATLAWALFAAPGLSVPGLPTLRWLPPQAGWLWLDSLGGALPYLPLALPFALLTLVGGIDNTESASTAGDAYATRDILLVEGVATFVAAVFGGTLQNTPYIGHPAYKRMGCRAGYTVATGLFIGVGASLGLIAWLLAWLPESVLVPILVYVGLEMASQALRETHAAHLPALVLGFAPAIAKLVSIHVNSLLEAVPAAQAALGPAQRESLQALTMLGNGFIVTSMLWSTLVIDLVDRRPTRLAVVSLLAAALTVCGVIHSPYPDGRLFLPSADLPAATVHLAAGYLLFGAVTWSLDRWDRSGAAGGGARAGDATPGT